MRRRRPSCPAEKTKRRQRRSRTKRSASSTCSSRASASRATTASRRAPPATKTATARARAALGAQPRNENVKLGAKTTVPRRARPGTAVWPRALSTPLYRRRAMRGIRFCLVVLCAAFAVPQSAWAQWWNQDWAFRKQIMLDLSATGANVTGSPTDVPVLVRLSAANFGFFNDIQPDGDDLRFVAADDVTPLKYHIERFDAVNQMVLAWVRVPRLAGGTNSDFVYLYYGNPDAVAGDDRHGTYDVNEVAVYHFSDANGIASHATADGKQPEQFGAA